MKLSEEVRLMLYHWDKWTDAKNDGMSSVTVSHHEDRLHDAVYRLQKALEQEDRNTATESKSA